MPLALHMNRNGGLTLALSLTLFCGFTYVLLHNFLLALGHNGRLPPAVAAWAANGLFGCGGRIWPCVCSRAVVQARLTGSNKAPEAMHCASASRKEVLTSRAGGIEALCDHLVQAPCLQPQRPGLSGRIYPVYRPRRSRTLFAPSNGTYREHYSMVQSSVWRAPLHDPSRHRPSRHRCVSRARPCRAAAFLQTQQICRDYP